MVYDRKVENEARGMLVMTLTYEHMHADTKTLGTEMKASWMDEQPHLPHPG